MRAAADERFEVMADVLADRTNPVWDVADRAATLAALDRVGDLTKLDQQELYGVVTGALWLRDPH